MTIMCTRSVASLVAVVTLLAAGCGGGESPADATPGMDGSPDQPMDAAPRDASIDAGAPDANTPGTGAPDASASDAALPDANVPDAALPDAGEADAALPDANVPDAALPDAGEPDADLPDAGVVCGPGGPGSGTTLWSRRFGDDRAQRGEVIGVDGSGNPLITGFINGVVDFGGGPLPRAINDFFVAKLDGSAGHVWSNRYSGEPFDDHYSNGVGIGTDGAGNIVVGGYFMYDLNFGGGNVLQGAGDDDVFVVEFTPMGQHLWSRRFGDGEFQRALDMAVDDAGNVLITGYFHGTMDFGGGPLVSEGYDIFVAKLDTSGQHVWSRRFSGGPSLQIGRGIAVDEEGNVLITGEISGTVDFGGGPLTGAGTRNVFVVKLDADGQHVWSRRFGDGLSQYRQRIAVDDQGNVLLTGEFAGAVDFGGGPLTSAGREDIYVVKLDANGQHIWSQRFGDGLLQYGHDIAVDAQGGVLLTGPLEGSVDFGGGALVSAGSEDVYAVKLDACGGHVWSRRFGGASTQIGESVIVDRSGNAFVTGYFRGTVDFGTGPLTSQGSLDMFVVALQP